MTASMTARTTASPLAPPKCAPTGLFHGLFYILKKKIMRMIRIKDMGREGPKSAFS
jgi:hypothetical protein